MATRARIGLQVGDQVVSVYHHWDGYPEWLGAKLAENYSNKQVLVELFKKGDISTLESETDWNRNKLPEKIVLYYSDRGEETPAKVHDNLSEFIRTCKDCGAEYAYIFNENNNWNCLPL